eukprot:CAMPEP_0174247694 /NCGR_PEP_ID=MMETSP0417-20130205/42704_1 /TAXON_ID=242541 /ORGANISM="Mayorella sp, Strain BSH-02190019" /LENGTH=104 /DNA_ID=CAMNT_0015327555 /DNA_START=805 /DNA_END=1119 /DNA_ORIENTATION=+
MKTVSLDIELISQKRSQRIEGFVHVLMWIDGECRDTDPIIEQRSGITVLRIVQLECNAQLKALLCKGALNQSIMVEPSCHSLFGEAPSSWLGDRRKVRVEMNSR